MKYAKETYQNIAALARAMKADKSGVTALEYGLIAALIAGVIVVGVTSVGTNLKSTFTSLANSI